MHTTANQDNTRRTDSNTVPPRVRAAGVWTILMVVMVGLWTPLTAEAQEGSIEQPSHGPSAAGFPSHGFTAQARRWDRPQLNLHFGLQQPLLFGGFNVATDLRYGRFVFEYSHGAGLDYNRFEAAADSLGIADGLDVDQPWTTGFGVGYTLVDELYLMVEFKAHHYDLAWEGQRADYTTVSIGPALAWRFFIWRGLNITAYLRYWPTVWDSEGGDTIELMSPSGTLEHDPINLGIFGNLSLGWAFDV
ncbi:MAG: hypothetical protein AAFX99_16065 [Myxococcota bacterium]